jgi:hypothetical protein
MYVLTKGITRRRSLILQRLLNFVRGSGLLLMLEPFRTTLLTTAKMPTKTGLNLLGCSVKLMKREFQFRRSVRLIEPNYRSGKVCWETKRLGKMISEHDP